MDSSVEVWKVKQYGATVYHTAQQKGSKYQTYCRPETIKGESKYLDVLGPTEAQDRNSRNPDTPNVQMNHARRLITMSPKDWGTMIDDMDKARMINDPKSPYMMAAVNAFGRKKDDMFLKSFIAPVMEDKDGGTSVAFPNAQKIAAVSGGAISKLNLEALRIASLTFNNLDLDPDEQRFMSCRPADIYNLLSDDKLTNADYNVVKALVEGKVDTFMGFKFIMSNRLLKQSWGKYNLTTGLYDGAGTASLATDSVCVAWHGTDAMVSAVGTEIQSDMAKRADKSFNEQLYVKMDLGFLRMEDAKCLTIAVR